MEIRHVFWLIRKWSLFIFLACLIGALAGLTVSLLQPTMYQASTTVYFVTPNRTDVSSVNGDQQVAKAFATIPTSGSVIASTLQTLRDSSLNPTLLSSMVTVVNNTDTQFVTIQVRDSNPTRAAHIASTITNQSVALFNTATAQGNQTQQFVQQEMSRLEIEIKSLENQLDTLQNRPASSGSPYVPTATVNQLNAELSADRTLYNQLLSSYTNVSSSQAVVLQQAQIPQRPLGAGRIVVVAIGLLIGLVAITAVILFVEQRSGVLRPLAAAAPMPHQPTDEALTNDDPLDATLRLASPTRKMTEQMLSAHTSPNGATATRKAGEDSSHAKDDQQ